MALVAPDEAIEIGVLLNAADAAAANEIVAAIWQRFKAAGPPPASG